jgi:hypothetical protein
MTAVKIAAGKGMRLHVKGQRCSGKQVQASMSTPPGRASPQYFEALTTLPSGGACPSSPRQPSAPRADGGWSSWEGRLLAASCQTGRCPWPWLAPLPAYRTRPSCTCNEQTSHHLSHLWQAFFVPHAMGNCASCGQLLTTAKSTELVVSRNPLEDSTKLRTQSPKMQAQKQVAIAFRRRHCSFRRHFGSTKRGKN